MKFELKYLEKLAKLMQESELTEMQLEDQEQSVVLKREKQTVTAQQVLPVAQTQVITQEQPVTVEQTPVQPKEETPKTDDDTNNCSTFSAQKQPTHTE